MADYLVGFKKYRSGDINAFIVNTEARQSAEVPLPQVIGQMKNGWTPVNFVLQGDNLVGTNGSIERYCFMSESGSLNGKYPIVILQRLPYDSFLVSDPMGRVYEDKESNVVAYVRTYGIANGKLVEGSRIQSISGEYPHSEALKKVESGDKLKAKLKVLGSGLFEVDENMTAAIKSDIDLSQTENKVLKLPEGVLGIREKGFARTRFKAIEMPSTLNSIGEGAFMEMPFIEDLVVRGTVSEIPRYMCLNCRSLKSVELGPYIKSVKAFPFRGCTSLREARVHRGTINTFGVFPPGTRVKMI